MRLFITSALVLVAFSGTNVNAETPILIDFNRDNQGDPATKTALPEEFTAAGVAEDLTDATVIGINLPNVVSSNFEGGGVTFDFSEPFRGPYDNGTSGSELLSSYIYFNKDYVGPADVTLSGLTELLDANTNYKLYLFGTAGTGAGENSEFTYGGVTQTTAVPTGVEDLAVAAVSFDFSTGGTVEDTLVFGWSRVGENVHAAFNGLAITSTGSGGILGDVDFDGDVDRTDVALFVAAYGTNTVGGGVILANFDDDTKVGLTDLAILQQHFGETGLGGPVGIFAPAAAVPEPSALLISIMGMIGWLAFGSRRKKSRRSMVS